MSEYQVNSKIEQFGILSIFFLEFDGYSDARSQSSRIASVC